MHPRGLQLITRAALRLPERLQRSLGRSTPAEVDGHLLDPQTQLLLSLQKLAGRPAVEDLDPVAAREMYRESRHVTDATEPTVASSRDRDADGVPVRIYRPHRASAPGPGLVFFHGGGAVIGDLDTHDLLCRFLAHRTRAVVIAVDYRLAPEHPFPCAPDDALAAYRWVHAHAGELDLDPARIGVAGDSFGGNLAAVLCLDARDGKAPAPALQLLIYPWVDMTLGMRSIDTLAEGYLLSRSALHWFRDHYVADPAQHRAPRAAPLYAPDLSGLPPAIVLTAGFDPLRDEGRAYADRLREAGVWTSHVNHRGLIHGFASMVALVDAARDATASAAAQVARQLHGPSQ